MRDSKLREYANEVYQATNHLPYSLDKEDGQSSLSSTIQELLSATVVFDWVPPDAYSMELMSYYLMQARQALRGAAKYLEASDAPMTDYDAMGIREELLDAARCVIRALTGPEWRWEE